MFKTTFPLTYTIYTDSPQDGSKILAMTSLILASALSTLVTVSNYVCPACLLKHNTHLVLSCIMLPHHTTRRIMRDEYVMRSFSSKQWSLHCCSFIVWEENEAANAAMQHISIHLLKVSFGSVCCGKSLIMTREACPGIRENSYISCQLS